MALSLKQQRFVSFYLGQSKGNQTDAARRAGYKQPRMAGSRLMTNDDIRKAVGLIVAEACLEAKDILDVLSAIALGNMRRFVELGRDDRWSCRDSIKACELLGRYRGLWRGQTDDGGLLDAIKVAEEIHAKRNQ